MPGTIIPKWESKRYVECFCVVGDATHVAIKIHLEVGYFECIEAVDRIEPTYDRVQHRIKDNRFQEIKNPTTDSGRNGQDAGAGQGVREAYQIRGAGPNRSRLQSNFRISRF